MSEAKLDLHDVQQPTSIPKSYEGMMPSRPSFVTKTDFFGYIQTSHKSLGSSNTSSRGQTPRFHTPGSIQGLEAKLDEHRRAANMFQQVIKYNTQMTNILLNFFALENHLKNEKNVQNL